MTLYAVFHEGQQITDPSSFERANELAAAIAADMFLEDKLNVPGGMSLYEVLPVS